ncbi:MAG TPA: radical SAM protein [Dehalococcoidia bacterium]|nr:radical SAM protein [Dehalococcoidia bacterium]
MLDPRSSTLDSREIHFYAPGLKRYETSEYTQANPRGFIPISLTGSGCALQCDHCRGKLLESMVPLGESNLFEVCRTLKEKGAHGVLVTGGADARGRVPLLDVMEDLGRVKGELSMQVVVHTGLVRRTLAGALARSGIDGAMIDILGVEETIRDVYHLAARVEDYAHSLEALTGYGVPSIPHIVLGLHYGRFLGEDAALQMVASYPVSALVLVILTPWDGTPMAGVRPPDPAEVGAFFHRARRALPKTPVLLGCSRPGGPYKWAVDRLAVDAGLDGIAYPAEGIVEYAAQRGLTPRFHEECCSLVYKEAWKPVKEAFA